MTCPFCSADHADVALRFAYRRTITSMRRGGKHTRNAMVEHRIQPLPTVGEFRAMYPLAAHRLNRARLPVEHVWEYFDVDRRGVTRGVVGDETLHPWRYPLRIAPWIAGPMGNGRTKPTEWLVANGMVYTIEDAARRYELSLDTAAAQVVKNADGRLDDVLPRVIEAVMRYEHPERADAWLALPEDERTRLPFPVLESVGTYTFSDRSTLDEREIVARVDRLDTEAAERAKREAAEQGNPDVPDRVRYTGRAAKRRKHGRKRLQRGR